jgi:branched-chain amino acid transport system ATP-binding protein
MPTKQVLTVSNLTKRFGGVIAVNDLSFSVSEGEMIGIVGPNGAGKTTVFNLITGFLRKDSGSISFDGMEISHQSPHKISQLGISRTFQQVRSFQGLSVMETMSMPLLIRGRPVDKGALSKLLESVGLKGKENAMARSLTYVEAKSLEICKAIVIDPKLLLLDEPFGGLNVHEIEVIGALIRRQKDEGRTSVIIEHRLAELFALAGRIVVMDFGQKIADGNPQEVVRQENVIEAYIGRVEKSDDAKG